MSKQKQPPQQEPLLLTIRQAARRIQMSDYKTYMMARSGDLPLVRIGRSVRIPVKALERWVEDRTTMAPEASHATPAGVSVPPAIDWKRVGGRFP